MKIAPTRSLPRSGFLWVMLAAGGGSTAIGTYLWWIGAWPVIGFGGLDILLLYLAFRASYAHARLFERVRLTPDELGIERVWPGGRRESWRLEPYWARVETEAVDGEVARLAVVSKGQSVVLGSFLSPLERTDCARRLNAALRTRAGNG